MNDYITLNGYGGRIGTEMAFGEMSIGGGGGFFLVGYDSGNYTDVFSSCYGALAVGYRTYF
jgi:hypothetical protein